MTITRKITAATAILAIAGSGVAAAADAPVVSAQKTMTTKTAPWTIPGTGIKKGERLPSGARLIYRDVTLEGTQTVTFKLRAPAGKTVRATAPRGWAGDRIGFSVVGGYRGHRQITLRAYRDPSGPVRTEPIAVLVR